MANDEEDYMSDKYLLEASNSRPGLPIVNRIANQIKRDERHKRANERNKVKPMKEREHESREEGMAKALDNTNVGFALLQKMGYKKGSGLGKEGTGRSEPIPISLKADRGGLGRETHLKRQQEVKKTLLAETAKKRIKIEQKQREEFRKHMSNRFVDKLIQSDLYKSQKACEQLDKSKELTCSTPWYWPEMKTEDDEDKEQDSDELSDTSDEELEPHEKLIQLTSYLRSLHYYCIWCGTTYEDESDLTQNCPGNTADDHE